MEHLQRQLTQLMAQLSLTFAMKTMCSLKSVLRLILVLLVDSGQMKTSSAVSHK